MSSYYGLLFPEYWDGPTGRLIQRYGGKDATVLGAFLISNRRANMIGLYRLPIEDIVQYTPLTRGSVERAFAVLEQPDVLFAHYDAASEFTWVREMARVRVGLRNRSVALKEDDKRVDFINRLYQQLDDNPFLSAFYERYRKMLHLKRLRTCEHYPKIEPLGRGLQGPTKPVTGSVTVQGSGSGSETDQDQGRSAPHSRRETRTSPGVENMRRAVLVKLVHSLLDDQPELASQDRLYELAEEVKVRAATSHIAYNATGVGEAIDQALAQRAYAESRR